MNLQELLEIWPTLPRWAQNNVLAGATLHLNNDALWAITQAQENWDAMRAEFPNLSDEELRQQEDCEAAAAWHRESAEVAARSDEPVPW